MTRVIVQILALMFLPFLLTGIIHRAKSLWSGRKGAPLFQSMYDVLRLLRKSSVYSTTTTPVFRIAPWVFLVTALASSLLVPLSAGAPMASFDFDFVWFAYVWALGRMALMLAALDTGSSFEGMGAAREATFSTLLEPGLFLVSGALCLQSGHRSLGEALVFRTTLGDPSRVVWAFCIVALFVIVQAENARIPVDDPNTHLELTMIHEVMVLDHSGPDLAAIQTGSAVKMFVGISLVATLLNPLGGGLRLASAAVHFVLCCGLAALVGTIESLIARLKLGAVPLYLAGALTAGTVALLATSWRSGGPL